MDLLVRACAGVLVLHAISIILSTSIPYHHRQCHALRIFPLLYLTAVHALRSTIALQGSSLSLWSIHTHCMHHIFSCGRCVLSRGSLIILGGCVQNSWSSGYSLFRSLPDHGYVVVYNPYLHRETECVTVLLHLHNYNSSYTE